MGRFVAGDESNGCGGRLYFVAIVTKRIPRKGDPDESEAETVNSRDLAPDAYCCGSTALAAAQL